MRWLEEEKRGAMAPLFYKQETGLAGATSLNVGIVRLLIGAHPIVDLPLCLVFCDPIFFPDLPYELFVLAVNDIYVIVCQFAPTLSNGAFQLFPLALHLI